MDREAEISLRAYRIWERKGRPFGEHDDHWEEARRELEAEEALAKGRAPQKPGPPDRT